MTKLRHWKVKESLEYKLIIEEIYQNVKEDLGRIIDHFTKTK